MPCRHVGFLIPREDGLRGGEQGDFAHMVAKLGIGMGRHEPLSSKAAPTTQARVVIFTEWIGVQVTFPKSARWEIAVWSLTSTVAVA